MRNDPRGARTANQRIEPREPLLRQFGQTPAILVAGNIHLDQQGLLTVAANLLRQALRGRLFGALEIRQHHIPPFPGETGHAGGADARRRAGNCYNSRAFHKLTPFGEQCGRTRGGSRRWGLVLDFSAALFDSGDSIWPGHRLRTMTNGGMPSSPKRLSSTANAVFWAAPSPTWRKPAACPSHYCITTFLRKKTSCSKSWTAMLRRWARSPRPYAARRITSSGCFA